MKICVPSGYFKGSYRRNTRKKAEEFIQNTPSILEQNVKEFLEDKPLTDIYIKGYTVRYVYEKMTGYCHIDEYILYDNPEFMFKAIHFVSERYYEEPLPPLVCVTHFRREWTPVWTKRSWWLRFCDLLSDIIEICNDKQNKPNTI